MVAGVGLFAGNVVAFLHVDPAKPHTRKVERATGLCLTQPALASPIMQPIVRGRPMSSPVCATSKS